MDKFTNRTLHTGNEMPVLGLGTWQLTDSTAGTIINALNIGYRMIDTSGDYGTQPGIGEGLHETNVPREDYYIVSKVEETDDAYEASRSNLEELQLQYVDLMLIHRPPESGSGLDLWQGLIRAKKEGLVKDIGVSNYDESLIEKLIFATGEKPVVNQIEWTPFGYSQDMLDFCNEHDIIIQAYSPLTRSDRLDDPALLDIAERYHKTPAQILIRWNLQMGTVPIIKANSFDHQAENLEVFDFEIESRDMHALNALNEEYSSLGASLAYS